MVKTILLITFSIAAIAVMWMTRDITLGIGYH